MTIDRRGNRLNHVVDLGWAMLMSDGVTTTFIISGSQRLDYVHMTYTQKNQDKVYGIR